MEIEPYIKRLLAKQEELTADIARLEREGRQAREAEVQDPIDVVNSDTGKAEAFEESTIDYATLKLVREALQRIEQGTYGICIDCGEPISEARLSAVPWTPYCRNDQEKHDREACETDNRGGAR